MAGESNNARARQALENSSALAQPNEAAATVDRLLHSDAVRKRFEAVLGAKAAGFMSSVITVTNGSRQLKEADPKTIIAAAAVAASLDLPINPSLGFAFIVPYRNHGKSEAQFQVGYRGYIQLALRTGQYKAINAGPVFDGEIEPATPQDRIKGELRFVVQPDGSLKDEQGAKAAKRIAGYAAYFRLLNGAEKWDYMTVAEVEAHAKRFSQSYGRETSPWKTDFDAMACKTVLKRLLSHYGILSVEMQTAVLADQAVVRDADGGGPDFDYADNAGDAVEVDATVTGAQPEQGDADQGSLV